MGQAVSRGEQAETKKRGKRRRGGDAALSIFPGELIQGIFAINSGPRGTFSPERENILDRRVVVVVAAAGPFWHAPRKWRRPGDVT